MRYAGVMSKNVPYFITNPMKPQINEVMMEIGIINRDCNTNRNLVLKYVYPNSKTDGHKIISSKRKRKDSIFKVGSRLLVHSLQSNNQ